MPHFGSARRSKAHTLRSKWYLSLQHQRLLLYCGSRDQGVGCSEACVMRMQPACAPQRGAQTAGTQSAGLSARVPPRPART